MTRRTPPTADWNDLACDVTEAAMLAGIESVKAGDRITPDQSQGLLIGLLRAGARWAVMMYPAELDGGFVAAFTKCLQQERAEKARQNPANQP